MDLGFERELRESLFVHRPLPLHREHSLEAAFPHKHVTAKRALCSAFRPGFPRREGVARLTHGSGLIRMTAPLRASQWPKGAPEDGDYCNFGTAGMVFDLEREDWRGFNRLRFWVRPQIHGGRILHLNVSIVNQGAEPVPDPYFREGATVFDLENGGWHDAGDQSQQSAQTGEIVQALFENANRVEKGSMLYLRLMEEAQWGLDFILRTRFGDGFRATSAGATRVTDGLMGNFDDVEARVHDHAFENFLLAGVEAYAAGALQGYDKGLAVCALKAAREDFGFAEKKFALAGVDPAHMYEHTYNSGLSQYYAVMVWAASCLFEVTKEDGYAKTARQYAGKLLACQEQGQAGIGLTGFFCRDESHQTIVHFNHQAREHQFMQALEAICRTQPAAEERPLWEAAMERYGGYLKAIAGNTAPYGMLPAGVHKRDEWQDRALFPYLHVTCDYDRERENYREQLAAGTPVGEGYVLRNFPVWFSFRGNGAVLLSMGKAAGIVGRYCKDPDLTQMAKEQLYWMWGKNPFGQSLVYGMGRNYCRQYAVLTGESVGEVPVGVETLGNGDLPYWPQNNNATFREVWVGNYMRRMRDEPVGISGTMGGRRPGNANARRAFGKFTRPWPEGMGAAVSRED